MNFVLEFGLCRYFFTRKIHLLPFHLFWSIYYYSYEIRFVNKAFDATKAVKRKFKFNRREDVAEFTLLYSSGSGQANGVFRLIVNGPRGNITRPAE